MLNLALENQGVVVIEEMVAAFARNGRFAVTLLGVLQLTFVSIEFSWVPTDHDVPSTRSTRG